MKLLKKIERFKENNEIPSNEFIEECVNYIISLKDDFTTVSQYLRNLQSEYSVDYAYKIYCNSTNDEEIRLAVFTLKEIAHPKSIIWIEEFLNNPKIIGTGLSLLDQLLWCKSIKPSIQTEKLMDLALKNSNSELKETVDFIKSYLKHKS